MRLTISYAINVILSIIILYLLSSKACNPCPETLETETTETVVAQPVDTNKVHGGTATVVVKKGVRPHKRDTSVSVVEDQPTAATPGDSFHVAHLPIDSVTLNYRDSLFDINAVLALQGSIVGSPVITYRQLKPSRYDHYINTKEYISTDKWLRLYAGGNIIQDSSKSINFGASGAIVFPRMMVDYTYVFGLEQHQVGIKARLFGK